MTWWARLWRRTIRMFDVDAVPVIVVDDLAPDPSGWSAGYADTAGTGFRTVARRLPLLIATSLRLAAEASKPRTVALLAVQTALYDARVSRIPPQDIDEVLEEMALGDARLRSAVAIHRALLALGGDTGYRALGDPKEATHAAGAAIGVGDWDALRACGTIELTVHGRAFLGGVHGVAAELMSAGEAVVSPAMAERVGALARDAQPWERGQAAADLTAIGDASILALLATVPASLDG